MVNRVYDEDTKTKAVELLNRGVSVREASKKLKIPQGTLQGWKIKSMGGTKVLHNTPGNMYDDDFKRQAMQPVLDGQKTVKEVAAELGVKYHRIYDWHRRILDANKKQKKKEAIKDLKKSATKAKNLVSKDIFESIKIEEVRCGKDTRVEMLKAQNEYYKKLLALNHIEI
jgi:transposase-like protein